MIDIMRYGFSTETFAYVLAFLIAIVLSITVHEFSHGYVAYWFGDNTASLKGRLTLNPLAHFDAFGFISLLLFGFGWAKPVPVNSLKFNEYRKGIFFTSIAGVVANFILAFFSAGCFVALIKLFGNLANMFYIFFKFLFQCLLTINLSLAVFNLLPIYPLDGFNALSIFVKRDSKFVRFMLRYGYIILLLLIITTLLSYILRVVTNFIATPFINFWDWVL